MTKTEIQVLDKPHREIRCGAELLVQVDPESPPADMAPWTPPTSSKEGWKGLSAARLHDAVFADSDPILTSHLAL